MCTLQKKFVECGILIGDWNYWDKNFNYIRNLGFIQIQILIEPKFKKNFGSKFNKIFCIF